jgi:predicted enzyme involved in methoxymalonyl-ACP biosynthesis
MQKSVSPSVIRKKIEVNCDKQSLIYEVYKRPHVDFFLKTVSSISSSSDLYKAVVVIFLISDKSVV